MPSHQRLQIEIRPEDELLMAQIRRAFGGDSDAEATRRLLALFKRIVSAIEGGGILSIVPAGDDRAVDFAPELTISVRPEVRYRFLMPSSHPWRRQLVLKGRRMTVGNLLGSMQAEGWTAERTAQEYDLPLQAVLEALEYGTHNEVLLQAEAAEERRGVLSAVEARSANAATTR
jgi:uncharacterized protein (DUF433 family)